MIHHIHGGVHRTEVNEGAIGGGSHIVEHSTTEEFHYNLSLVNERINNAHITLHNITM